MKKIPMVVIANNVRSLKNVGSFFRICDAFGVEKLYLCGVTGCPKKIDDERFGFQIEKQTKEIEKTAIKTVPFVDWEYRSSAEKLIEELRSKGYHIVSVEQDSKSQKLEKMDFKFPLCLIFGHETLGVPSTILNISDEIAEIPMFGKGKSLNVAVSCALVLQEVRRRFAIL